MKNLIASIISIVIASLFAFVHDAHGQGVGGGCSNYGELPFTELIPGPIRPGCGTNVNRAWGIAPGDFPPLTHDVQASTSPLVSPGQQAAAAPISAPTRLAAAGVLDAVMGVPLVQQTDFELPFGGAVFRHIRTYSEVPSAGNLFEHELPTGSEFAGGQASTDPWQPGSVQFPLRSPWGGTNHEPAANGLYWDWHGQGWMMSENPLFLFDASYWGISNDNDFSDGSPAIYCYFVPDAHRTIPFIRQAPAPGDPEARPVYVSPPGYDAVMEVVGGVWQAGTGNSGMWTTLPTGVRIWLHGGAVRYDIQIYGGDMPSLPDGTSYNAPRQLHADGSFSGGFGIPYFGVATRIEDRAGNRIDLEYTQRGLPSCAEPDPACPECDENCHEAGQLRRARLYAAGEYGTAKWTLLYVNREFASEPIGWPNALLKRQSSTHVHAIYVYQGDVDTATPGTRLTLPYGHFAVQGTNDDTIKDQLAYIDAIDGISLLGLPTTWVHCSRYMYTDPMYLDATVPISGIDNKIGQVFWANMVLELGNLSSGGTWFPIVAWQASMQAPKLLKATTLSRKTAGSDVGESKSVTIYKYNTDKTCYSSLYTDTNLHGIVSPDTVATLLESIRRYGIVPSSNRSAGTDPIALPGPIDENDLLCLFRDDKILVRMPTYEADSSADPEQSGGATKGWTNAFLCSDVLFATMASGVTSDGLRCVGSSASLVGDIRHLAGLSPSQLDRLLHVQDGNGQVTLKAYGDSETLTFELSRFLIAPESSLGPVQPSTECSQFRQIHACRSQIGRGLYHYPFRFVRDAGDLIGYGYEYGSGGYSRPNPGNWALTPADEARWVVVIQERVIVLEPDSNGSMVPTDRVRARHLYKLNASGVVLVHRTYDGEGRLVGQTGMDEQYVYDEYNRLVEHRTFGWGSAENAIAGTQGTDGLIWVYEYEEPTSFLSVNRNVLRVGVKRGADATSADTVWVKAFEYHPDIPGTIAETKVFNRPLVGAASAGAGDVDTTSVTCAFAAGSGTPASSYISAMRTVHPAEVRAPGGAAVSAEEWVVYDDSGNVTDVGRGVPGMQFTWTRHTYDSDGYLISTVDDSDATPTISVSGATAPARAPASVAALALTTLYGYDDRGETIRVEHPDGTVDLTVVVGDPETQTRYNFRGLTSISGASPSRTCRASRPLEIQHLKLDVLTESEFATISGTVSESSPTCCTRTVYATVKARYDGAGKVIGLAADSVNSLQTLEASVWYDGLGKPIRSKAPDGTITRTTYDTLGRIDRVFRGSKDKHFYWGTAALGSLTESLDCRPGTASSGGTDDDMALVSKQEYGEGIRNAMRPTVARQYRDRPTDQYCALTSTENGIGRLDETFYDWRMRPVVVRTAKHNLLGEVVAVKHEVTWLDHRDRARFRAVYGQDGVPTAIDPRGFAPTSYASAGQDGAPEAADILGAAYLPLELMEFTYSPSGEVTSQTRHAVPPPSSPSATGHFERTLSWHDHQGRVTTTRSSFGADTRYIYDAAGKLVRVSTFAGPHSTAPEIERTVTTYDAFGNAIGTTRHERLPSIVGGGGTPSMELDAGNSVQTFVQSYYDSANRLIAAIDFGTNQGGSGDDTFTTGDVPDRVAVGLEGLTALQRWETLDAEFTLPKPKISTYAYDAKGQRVEMFDPAKLQTRYEHDEFGRLKLQIENAPGGTDLNWAYRRTAYIYDAGGRLIRIAALRPDAPETIPWSTLQTTTIVKDHTRVTEILYDAEVVDSNGVTISRNPGLISAIRFPRKTCNTDYDGNGSVNIDDIFVFLNAWFDVDLSTDFTGNGRVDIDDIFVFLNAWFAAPTNCAGYHTSDDLQFKYTVDGLVASRTDLNATTLLYVYDIFSRLTSVTVSDASGRFQGPNAPVNSVSSIQYVYDELGRLTEAASAASAQTTGASPYVVAANHFGYDELGYLSHDAQELGGPVQFDVSGNVTSPATGYVRATGEVDGAAFSRLTGIAYPYPLGSPTVIGFEHGTVADQTDARLNRVTRVFGGSSGGSPPDLARYTYAGASRRVKTQLGVSSSGGTTAAAIVQSFIDSTPSNGLSGLDRFGRPKVLEWMGSTLTTPASPLSLYRVEYGYDQAHERSRDAVTMPNAASPSTPASDRSWMYVVQEGRLTTATTGSLMQDVGGAYTIDYEQAFREQCYALDDLNNWGRSPVSGDSQGAADTTLGWWSLGGGVTDAVVTLRSHSAPNSQLNRITNGAERTGINTVEMVYDRAGRLIWDGQRFYQYDALGRLVQVNDLAAAPVMDSSGNPVPGTLGGLVLHLSYDALGRVAARQTPTDAARDHVRLEKYLYDGVRRVQELHSTAVGSAVPVPLDVTLWPSGLSTGVTLSLQKQFIWQPDGYVDDLLALVDGSGDVLYGLQDVNHNLVGLADSQGRPALQYSYTPYGTVQAIDVLQPGVYPPSLNSIGHQGLFFDNLVEPWVAGLVEHHPEGAVTWAPVNPANPNGPQKQITDLRQLAWGMYQNRNRTYMPTLGRFLQRDPNASGQPVGELFDSGMHPAAMSVDVASLSSMYGDGGSLHAYLGGKPTSRTDPLGLEFTMGGMSVTTSIQSQMRAIDNSRATAYATSAARAVAPIVAAGGGTAGVPGLATGSAVGSLSGLSAAISVATGAAIAAAPIAGVIALMYDSTGGMADLASRGELGEYRKVGGHHIHQQAAFRDHIKYDPRRGLSISQEFMLSRGWNHQAMNATQRRLQDELARSGQPNTMAAQSGIAVEALVQGGASRVEATQLVRDSLMNLYSQGVTSPTRIPWQ